jgi:ubiquinone/menaquinone biosynthesis C-methylase UbiE
MVSNWQNKLTTRHEFANATSFLEVGPGRTETSAQILTGYPNLQATFIDFDIIPILEVMKARKLDNRCRFLQANLASTGLASAQFQVIFLKEMLRQLGPRDDPDWARELTRLLAPGGTVFVAETVGLPENEDQKRFIDLTSFEVSIDRSLGNIDLPMLDQQQAASIFDNTVAHFVEKEVLLDSITLTKQEIDTWTSSIKKKLTTLMGGNPKDSKFKLDGFEGLPLERPRKMLFVFKNR